jgi:hypothetical protein
MILSTIAKNMPLNMLSTKPEFEINIWDIHSVTVRHQHPLKTSGAEHTS